MFYGACVPSTEGLFIILTLLSHPLQGSVPHLNIKASVDNAETLESTKNLQQASRAKEENRGLTAVRSTYRSQTKQQSEEVVHSHAKTHTYTHKER